MGCTFANNHKKQEFKYEIKKNGIPLNQNEIE